MSEVNTPVVNSKEESSVDNEPEEIIIDRLELDRVIARLTEVIEDGIKTGIKRGLFHLPASDRHLLLIASDMVQKSQKFPNYKLTFYHKGMGEGTNTCAVTFTEI
ncbi:hypothetical protein [Pseudanabaena yagii]|uniref:hypothetical protein n=1 Tax=Pseudanabaena yagii TaxID=2661615 RepID=UPI001CEC29D8|nr:hypothetical protein [Pseudanabaena yagii]